MKKFSYFLMALLMSCMFMACTGCAKQDVNEQVDTTYVDSVNVDSTELTLPLVENFISTDREEMFLHYGKDYRWYETQIVFKDYLDSEDASDAVGSITNVFQYILGEDDSYDTYVAQITHFPDTTAYETDHSFWIEDFPLNNEAIKLTFSQALERLYEANLPKPHSRKCTLRLPIGPLECNPQYVFGNIHETVFVDAVTGEVKNSNPAFPGEGFKMPLGEWP